MCYNKQSHPDAWLLTVCLVMLFLTEILSHTCSQLRQKLLEDNRDNVKLLASKMGASFPRQCIPDIIKFSSKPSEDNVPDIHELQKEHVTVVIHEILKQILHIFNQNHTNLSWDENSITVFKLGLDQQIEKVGACFGSEPDESRNKVREYFERIHNFLKDKEYSLCAWEIAQIEFSQYFTMLDQLIQKLPEEEDPVLVPEAKDADDSSPQILPEMPNEETKKEEFSQGCSQLQRKLKEANKDNLELLNNNMGSTVPRLCLRETINFFSKPNDENLQIVRECREKNATEAIYEILRQIVLLFEQNHTQLSWDEDSTAVFELGLDHEIGILGPCLRSGMAPLNIRRAVMRYFRRTNDLLKDKITAFVPGR
ncbi:hypothetical protein JRQ81_013376 [Phrynocephalus forsythii]|uniref:Uncharacterized protein n=1 Tax=Phrynocephalus forsythii TaxID=171643 RepID=A0A9Q0XZ24_9SAUR|nr:hypothetical protein JRQ81_013376 [Phrynocephalus forsythii]